MRLGLTKVIFRRNSAHHTSALDSKRGRQCFIERNNVKSGSNMSELLIEILEGDRILHEVGNVLFRVRYQGSV
jgi:hypothetical protein